MDARSINEFFKKRFFTIQETASFLCMSEGSVRTLINSGSLPKRQNKKRGKIYLDLHDIEKLIEENKTRVID